jgi:putative DNA primase/helicase
MNPHDYARGGWRVFPCHRKTPLIRKFSQKASIDPDVIAEWWRDWPRAWIGVPTGRESGFVVADVDVKNLGQYGFDTLADLGHSILPETWMAHTPSGGLHLYFDPGERTIGNSVNKLGPGLDIRGDGGFVIVPGAGSGYWWDPHCNPETVALMAAPDWLVPPEPERRPPAPRPERLPGMTAYGEGALDSAVKRIIAAPAGLQHDTLLRESCSIGAIAGAELPAELARKVLKWAGQQMASHDPRQPWRDADIDRTVDNGFDFGMHRPRGTRR